MYDTIGIIGAIIVTYSNIPQMWLFFKQGHAKGISLSSTWIGTVGLLLRTIFLIHTTGFNWIVLGPYFFAIACCLFTLYYCYFPSIKDPFWMKYDAKSIKFHQEII